MSDSFLQMDGVSFAYSGGHTILENIDLQINKGELAVIKGESGAGKSTLLKLFNRFCEYTGGRITYDKKELKDYVINDLRRSILYLPQLPVVIDGSIKDNLIFPFRFHAHKDKIFDNAKARKWLDYFQIDLPFENDSLKLSIGQKQRISLVRALLLDPEVILLDEPGSALDRNNRILIENKIESLRSSGITVIMATHSDLSLSNGSYRDLLIKDKSLIEKGRP